MYDTSALLSNYTVRASQTGSMARVREAENGDKFTNKISVWWGVVGGQERVGSAGVNSIMHVLSYCLISMVLTVGSRCSHLQFMGWFSQHRSGRVRRERRVPRVGSTTV